MKSIFSGVRFLLEAKIAEFMKAASAQENFSLQHSLEKNYCCQRFVLLLLQLAHWLCAERFNCESPLCRTGY